MSEANGAAPAAPAKRKQTRNVSGPKTVFLVVQVLDEQGKPTAFDKDRIRVIDVDGQPDRMLATYATVEKDHGFFLRAVLHGRTPRATNTSDVQTAPQMQAQPASPPTAQRPT